MKTFKILLRPIVCCLFCLFAILTASAGVKNENILIITSYNPDTERMNANLTEFFKRYKELAGSTANICIETMNCKNLSESSLWKDRMERILKLHSRTPLGLVVLLGQEAWTAYLAQDLALAKKTPCMAAMVSTNTIVLPKGNSNLRICMPESKEYTDFKDFNIVGGIFYKYNLDKNIEIIRKFYPNTKNIAFISDFTLGGLMLQSLVNKEMQKYKDLNLQFLDGRRNTLFNICNMLKHPQPNTVLLVGTWRIDSSENYVLANTTSVLRDANSSLPAFSMTSVGLGNWAIGGYSPEFSLKGAELADIAYDYMKSKIPNKKFFHICHNNYILDKSQIDAFDLDSKLIPNNAIVINQTQDFYTKNRRVILRVLSSVLILVFGLLIAIYYIAHMSHEIRTPLNAIVGFSELQTMDDYSKEDKIEFGKIIKENSDLLLNLINDILDISRIESGRVNVDLRQCDIVKLCHGCLVSVSRAKPLEHVEYQEEYPVGKLEIKTDNVKLQQVIINLLTNASKFTKKGHIRLSFTVDEAANTITFVVADTGIGIPKDQAEAVFDRFVKLNKYAQGTGLGLSLCRIIVERLGGKIWLDTSYTGGARFMFTTPIVPPALDTVIITHEK